MNSYFGFSLAFIIKMYKNGFTPEQIAAATDKTLEDVNSILSSKDEQ